MSVGEVTKQSYHQAPEPGYMRHSATYTLDMFRGFDLETMTAAAKALTEAGVPLSATVQVNYGNVVIASWSVEAETPPRVVPDEEVF